MGHVGAHRGALGRTGARILILAETNFNVVFLKTWGDAGGSLVTYFSFKTQKLSAVLML